MDTGPLIEENRMHPDSGMLKTIAEDRARRLRAEATAARRARRARKAKGE